MSDSSQNAVRRFGLFDVAFHSLRLVSTVAICTIAGYMVVGGIVGNISMMLGAKTIAQMAVGSGWILGGIVGVANEIPRIRRSWLASDEIEDETTDQKKTSRIPNYSIGPFRLPGISGFLKSVGICAVIGNVLGLMLSVFLSLVLISVTTSPFVPDSWRPGTRPLNETLDARQHDLDRRNRDGVGISFTHPLLEPIFLYSVSSLAVLGVVAGGVTAFFPSDEQTSNSD